MGHVMSPGRDRERRPVRRLAPSPAAPRLPARDMHGMLLHLQSTAGNQAVNSLLRGWRSTGGPVVQRAPDPREEAIKEALAELQHTADMVDDDEKPAAKGTRYRPDPLALTQKDMCGGRKCVTDEEIYGPIEEAKKRSEKEMEEWRELAKIPYKDRLYKARHAASVNTQQEDFRKLTAEEVWNAGFVTGSFFFEHEKSAVYDDQNEMRKKYGEKLDEEYKQEKAKAESDQYQNWVAQGEQNSSPAGIIEPAAFSALGELVGAAYLGVQTGELLGDTYNDCVKGGEGDCSTDLVQLALTVATAKATHGESEASPSPQEDIRGVRDQEGNITIRGEPEDIRGVRDQEGNITIRGEPTESASKRGGSPVLKGPIPDEEPANLNEQLVLDEARAGAGSQIIPNARTPRLGDEPRLVANYGPGEWVKMQHTHEFPGKDNRGVTIHWFLNKTTGQAVEYKFTRAQVLNPDLPRRGI